mmetsp:Transcript_3318/g.5687  ORF Transcript_3318/g.5687 Transcript_3318/m.5687 type:complete len:125 (+) Transcript_3318:472-846(+)
MPLLADQCPSKYTVQRKACCGISIAMSNPHIQTQRHYNANTPTFLTSHSSCTSSKWYRYTLGHARAPENQKTLSKHHLGGRHVINSELWVFYNTCSEYPKILRPSDLKSNTLAIAAGTLTMTLG